MVSRKRRNKLEPKVASAIEELKGMILAKYPDASFEVCPAIEDPGALDLVTTVDTDEIDEVIDLVVHRLVELDNEGIWIHVAPVQPIERILEKIRRGPEPWPIADLDLLVPLK